MLLVVKNQPYKKQYLTIKILPLLSCLWFRKSLERIFTTVELSKIQLTIQYYSEEPRELVVQNPL